MYETDFKDFSYGIRSGRSSHDAVDYLHKSVSFEGMYYIIDAGIKNYFCIKNHSIYRIFLYRKVKDGVVRRVIDKWLRAGVLDGNELYYWK